MFLVYSLFRKVEKLIRVKLVNTEHIEILRMGFPPLPYLRIGKVNGLRGGLVHRVEKTVRMIIVMGLTLMR